MIKEGVLKVKSETIVSLPIETIAFMILENYFLSKSWNKHNWFLAAKNNYGNGDAFLDLAEGWSWLISKGMLVTHSTQSSTDAYELSRTGKKALEHKSFEHIIAAEKIDLILHPTLRNKVRPVFLLGDYEIASFKAMKEVEVKVRKLSGLSASLIGTRLMRTAFHPDNGPLTNKELEAGERQARADLFAGAIGSFKNPTSHRPVSYNDPNEASEVIFLADLLLRLLEKN